ncbi:hypothetical protein BRC89_01340 [Halobacteriales archaeon QS_4_70_19]|nr:MAG: hypothetical protein BRC89_01340 [Halobacteriales archaeon QS_4_70_19]
MGTKSLTITEEAYERLKAQKRAGESFTDTIIRITERGDPSESFGMMAEVGGFREAVEGTREQFDEDLRDRADRRGE